MNSELPKHEIVLLGAGHTNAHILRMWKMNPPTNVGLTCISNFPIATYSGMLPGFLARQYSKDQMEIDLIRLCSSVGVRLIIDEMTGLDVGSQRIEFAKRPSIPFDTLAIGVGSRPTTAGIEADETLLKIKPMQTLVARLKESIERIAESKPKGSRLEIAIVGGGAGGVEVTFCIPQLLRTGLGVSDFHLTLINSDPAIPMGSSEKVQSIVRNELAAAGVEVVVGRRVKRVSSGEIEFEDGLIRKTDLAIWATSAIAPPVLDLIDLPKDRKGFLLTDETLRTTTGAPIFAVGDSGTIEGSEIPKAGVYAVREGPILWKNLQNQIFGKQLEKYKPQRNFLKLLNLGNGEAIAEYRGWATKGRWAFKLKDRIDRKFIEKYQDYQPMVMEESSSEPNSVMRCTGCGGKVGGSILSRVLKRLDIQNHPQVLLGLEQPDDAAVVQPAANQALAATVDFFAPPFDDPYLTGRIAALNAVSDVFAMDAEPFAALAQVVIPVGRPAQQEQLLYEMLSGSLEEFNSMNISLVGGHTIEGPQTTIGFTILANQPISDSNHQRQGLAKVATKAKLKPGDQLVLTKPLGTGVLLAGHMQALCRAEWMTPLIDSMLLNNQQAASLCRDFGIDAMTDVTGFGLATHLLEMLRASNVSCELELEEIPILPGASELVEQGVESTLAPANRDADADIEAPAQLRQSKKYPLLFDPQTSGGLLLAVDDQSVKPLLDKINEQSNVSCARIGTVVENRESIQVRIR